MTIKPLVELLAVKKKQEAKRSINEEIHTQVRPIKSQSFFLLITDFQIKAHRSQLEGFTSCCGKCGWCFPLKASESIDNQILIFAPTYWPFDGTTNLCIKANNHFLSPIYFVFTFSYNCFLHLLTILDYHDKSSLLSYLSINTAQQLLTHTHTHTSLSRA